MKPYSDLAKIIHREGYIFIVIFAVITFMIGSFSTTFGWIGTISTIWCAYFFRNPERVTSINDNFIISPADGIVQTTKEVNPQSELGLGDDEMIWISIFLNVFGSRADIYLPLKTAILVSEGQTCIGSETVLADMDLSKSSQPKFEVNCYLKTREKYFVKIEKITKDTTACTCCKIDP